MGYHADVDTTPRGGSQHWRRPAGVFFCVFEAWYPRMDRLDAPGPKRGKHELRKALGITGLVGRRFAPQ